LNLTTQALRERGTIAVSATATTEHVVTPASSSTTTTYKLASDKNNVPGDIADFTKTDLVVGEWYMISGQMVSSVNTSTLDGAFRSAASGAGTQYGRVYHTVAASSANATPVNIIFQAVSENLYFNISTTGGSTTLLGDDSLNESFTQVTNITRQFLAAVPTQKVAYLKDVKASGTAGGTFTSGAWQTRTLNTIEGDSEIVSLATNQFTLGIGKYLIEATAPAVTVDQHQSKIRNITDSTDDILGSSVYSRSTGGDQNNSVIVSTLTLTSSKTFELQHRCVTTTATFGFGSAATFGVDVTYSQVKITKLR
jgi:hypothetical protein